MRDDGNGFVLIRQIIYLIIIVKQKYIVKQKFGILFVTFGFIERNDATHSETIDGGEEHWKMSKQLFVL